MFMDRKSQYHKGVNSSKTDLWIQSNQNRDFCGISKADSEVCMKMQRVKNSQNAPHEDKSGGGGGICLAESRN